MPIYEYKCKHCDHKLEQLQKITDEPLQVCPACGQSQLVKLVSNAGFQLKGTGWYVTDFKNKPPEHQPPGAGQGPGASVLATKAASGSQPTEQK